MSDEGKLRIQADRGARAKAALDNEIYAEAYEKTLSKLREAIEESTWDETDRREFLYAEIRALKEIHDYMRRVMTTGEAAAKELQRPKDPSKIARVIHGRGN